MRAQLIGLYCIAFAAYAVAYFPGASPKTFSKGDTVPMKVNKLTSIHTQLPFEYYTLPFCPNKDGIIRDAENIGEFLRGDRVENSPYLLKFKEDSVCRPLCSMNYNEAQVNQFLKKIHYQYRVHWILDNLPAATTRQVMRERGGNREPVTLYENGFFLGGSLDGGKEEDKSKNPKFKLNNHVDMKILTNQEGGEINTGRIVGFEVKPKSVRYGNNLNSFDCTSPALPPLELETTKPVNVTWTYSVHWEETAEIPWINRWDRYLKNTDPQIHWYSIINSLMIVVFLTGMMAMIMMRTLNADLRRYNQEMGEEVEETGWKLVHGDVFRPPQRPMLLSVLVGSGVQVFGMSMVTLVFAALGFLSPANRGGLISAMVVLFVVMGVFAGYSSTRMFRMMRGNSWKKCTIATALAFPGAVFTIFFILNAIMAVLRSSGAVPVLTLFSILLLWFGISTPLVFLGSYFAYKQPEIKHPVRTNIIARQVPDQVWYMHPIFSILMGGILPFGAVFIELLFILTAIWGHQFYYIFGFLFIVFMILILTCSEISIIMCYFQLCSEDYHWWWRSFLTSGSSAFYMFVYAMYYYTRLGLTDIVPKLLYFGYSIIMTLGFFVLTGSIGYYSCYVFIRKIYAQIKVD